MADGPLALVAMGSTGAQRTHRLLQPSNLPVEVDSQNRQAGGADRADRERHQPPGVHVHVTVLLVAGEGGQLVLPATAFEGEVELE